MLAIMHFKTFKSKNRLFFSNFQLFGFLNICYQVSELIYIIYSHSRLSLVKQVFEQESEYCTKITVKK